MARPRVFVSSTYYDLKHLRASIDSFIRSLGFDAVLSEKGGIPYSSDRPLDESCYREAASSDIFVLIVGGRYGSRASGESEATLQRKLEEYDSITRREFDAAYDADIPIYILIEGAVASEYQTYVKNRGNELIKYAHVDSLNVFKFIDNIYLKNATMPFVNFRMHPILNRG